MNRGLWLVTQTQTQIQFQTQTLPDLDLIKPTSFKPCLKPKARASQTRSQSQAVAAAESYALHLR